MSDDNVKLIAAIVFCSRASVLLTPNNAKVCSAEFDKEVKNSMAMARYLCDKIENAYAE